MSDTEKEPPDKLKDLLKEIYESDIGLKAYVIGFYSGIVISLIILSIFTITQIFQLIG